MRVRTDARNGTGLRRGALFVAAAMLTAATAGCGGGAVPGAAEQVADTASGASTAALNVAPDPVPARSSYRATGCGYAAGLAVSGEDVGPAGTTTFSGTADAAGCLAANLTARSDTGAHTLKVYQQLKRGRTTLMGKTGFTVVPAPLAVTSESYVFQWDATKACIGEDDRVDWAAQGTLAPGQAFTFTPRYPECVDPRAVVVKVTAESSAQLVVSTVVPENDGVSVDATQKGKTISSRTVSGAATLCMFPNTSFTPPANYTITVVNAGTATANVNVAGRDRNDWAKYYFADCLAADADGDGWSDSIEHAMAQLVYPTGNYNNGALPAGTNYLRACGTPTANDEFDPWPPDLDDDGVVTDADVSLVAAHVGEGNGVPWGSIVPGMSTADSFVAHTGAWNRFDLNADGWVDDQDVALVQSWLGRRCAP